MESIKKDTITRANSYTIILKYIMISFCSVDLYTKFCDVWICNLSVSFVLLGSCLISQIITNYIADLLKASVISILKSKKKCFMVKKPKSLYNTEDNSVINLHTTLKTTSKWNKVSAHVFLAHAFLLQGLCTFSMCCSWKSLFLCSISFFLQYSLSSYKSSSVLWQYAGWYTSLKQGYINFKHV